MEVYEKWYENQLAVEYGIMNSMSAGVLINF